MVRYKGRLYFPEDPNPAQPLPLPGSFVAFTRNGSLQVGWVLRDKAMPACRWAGCGSSELGVVHGASCRAWP